jgi:aminoglycoside phosphotransferase (APT) family kinase protein
MRDLPGSPAAFGQAAGLAGPDATVQAVRELAGGTHARTWLVRTANPELEVVIREFPAGDGSARREARVLAALDGLDGLAPRLLAGDPGCGDGGGSWVVISRLPGSADITPGQPSSWARQLGAALARIHATSPRRLAGLQRVLDRPSGSSAGLSGPAAGLVCGRLAAAGRRAGRADA